MSKVFFPIDHIYVDASCPPHPPNTRYKISIGTEMWDNVPVQVIKVQMEYDGKVNGRVVPSFPVGTDDAERVVKAIEELKKRNGM